MLTMKKNIWVLLVTVFVIGSLYHWLVSNHLQSQTKLLDMEKNISTEMTRNVTLALQAKADKYMQRQSYVKKNTTNVLNRTADVQNTTNTSAELPAVAKVPVDLSYERALQRHADAGKTIILSVLDSSYIHMALNLNTSFSKQGLSNVLFICMDEASVAAFARYGIFCHADSVDPDGDSTSIWGSKAFKRKTGRKISVVLDALKLGYTVLLVDIDIVFFKNPLPYMDCKTCDVHYQYDQTELNSGFMYVRPTKASIELHEKAWHLLNNQSLTQQKAIAAILVPMGKQKKIKTKRLSDKKFPNGLQYYENRRRQFAGDNVCTECVLVHQNWIVGKETKQYRLKESLLWYVDIDSNEQVGYYTNPAARYLTYGNPGDVPLRMQLQALRTALIMCALLQRILILPAFTCHSCDNDACKVESGECSLMSHVEMMAFDSQFSYREHIFLKHPAVPDSIKSSTSTAYVFQKSLTLDKTHPADYHADYTVIADSYPDQADILARFASDNNHVLLFHSLYGSFTRLHDSVAASLQKKLQTGIVSCDYRQYCTLYKKH